MFSLTVHLFDYFYCFPVHTVSNKRACNRIDQILNQAIRWLLLRTYSIAISSTEGFKTRLISLSAFKGGRNRTKVKVITIRVHYDDFSTYTRSKTIPVWTSDIFVIKRTAMQLLSEFIESQKIRLVGVGFNLLSAGRHKKFEYFS